MEEEGERSEGALEQYDNVPAKQQSSSSDSLEVSGGEEASTEDLQQSGRGAGGEAGRRTEDQTERQTEGETRQTESQAGGQDEGHERVQGAAGPPASPVERGNLDTDSQRLQEPGLCSTSETSSQSEDTQIWVPTLYPEGRSPASGYSHCGPSGSPEEIKRELPPPPSLHDTVFKFPQPRKASCPGVVRAGPQASTSRSSSRDDRPKIYYTGPINGGARLLTSRHTPLAPCRPLLSEPLLPGHMEADRSSLQFTPTLHLPPGQDGDEVSRDDGSKSNDDVFLPDTPPPTPDRKQTLESQEKRRLNRLHVLHSMCVNVSGLYAMVLVVLGAVLPLSEAFTSSQSPHLFQGFYVYLFGTSLLFLAYLYLVLLRTGSCRLRCHGDRNNALLRALSAKARKKRFTYDDSPHSHTGSFYLRLGAVGFGMGSMIKSGLQLGEFLESDLGLHCRSLLYSLRPLLHLVFTFVQLYFVFLNSKICIQKHKVLVRMGLMHMAACNVCVWLENIVTESVIAIQEAMMRGDSSNGNTSVVLSSIQSIPSQRLLSLHSCKAGLMRAVVERSGPYLYPCSIEYSLICSGILYVMWRNVGKHVEQRTHENAHKEAKAKAQRLSVDCSSSSRGLFCGIFVLVAVVISIITFFVLTASAGRSATAVMLEHATEIVIYALTSVAVVLASIQMQPLRFNHKKRLDLEEALLLIGLTGIFIFSLFSIIAAALSEADHLTSVIVASSVLRMAQATLQTVFMLNAVRRRALDRGQERDKPGREFVTFLLVANIALWGINTFEVQQSEAHPVQLQFYGVLSWNIFTHISSPLAIYYRFHSTVCLSNVWKHAWKWKAFKTSSSSA